MSSKYHRPVLTLVVAALSVLALGGLEVLITGGLVAAVVYVVHRIWHKLLGPLAAKIPASILIWIFIGFSASDWAADAFTGQQMTIVIGFTLMTVSMFILQALEEIARSVAKAIPPAVTLGRIAGSIAYVIISYAVLYSAVYYIHPSSFSGVPEPSSLWRVCSYFAYFASLTFATVSFGDIVPQTLAAKWLVLSEVLCAFTFVVFILSNISMFQASFQKSSPLTVSREPISSSPGKFSESGDNEDSGC